LPPFAGIQEETGMNSAATELLPYEKAAKLDEEQLPATEKKWSRRRLAGFVIGASTLLWTLIILGVRGVF
jgi:hypothetical protein